MKANIAGARRAAPLLTALLLAAGISAAFGKTADDYFHGAAYQYVAGKIQEASVEAEEGLRLHPDDAKLRTLAEHLRKMKDQQRGNSGKGDGKDKNDKNKDDQKKPGDKNGKPDDSDKKNKEGKDGDRKGDKEQKQPDKPQPPKPGEDPKEKDGEGGKPPRPGKMNEEEAKRLLNSFADDEKKEQAERRRVLRQRAGTEQDW